MIYFLFVRFLSWWSKLDGKQSGTSLLLIFFPLKKFREHLKVVLSAPVNWHLARKNLVPFHFSKIFFCTSLWQYCQHWFIIWQMHIENPVVGTFLNSLKLVTYVEWMSNTKLNCENISCAIVSTSSLTRPKNWTCHNLKKMAANFLSVSISTFYQSRPLRLNFQYFIFFLAF